MPEQVQPTTVTEIGATEIIRLSVEDQKQIAEALLNPPEPTRALKKAFRRRRELFGL